MMYTIMTINGVKVGNIIKDPLKLSKFSPEQAYIIMQQIRNDLNKATNTQNNSSNTSQNNTSSDGPQDDTPID